MRYYARLGSNGDRDAVLKVFVDAGIETDNVILDTDKQQKRQGSAYMTLKNELSATRESLCIDRLFSLGKNAREVTKEIGWLKDTDIQLYVLDMPSTLDPDASMMDLLYEVNQEYAAREIRNLKAGQDAAARKQKKAGRPQQPYPPEWEELFKKYKNREITSDEFIEKTGLSRGTFFNMQRRYLQERRSAVEEIKKQNDESA